MTNEEAINELKSDCARMQEKCDCYGGCELGCHIYMAIKALEKADRYKWHDLRKKPDDLPEAPLCSAVDVIACFEGCSGEYVTKPLMYVNDWYPWRYTLDMKCDRRVIAWREVEPFDEVDKWG